MCDSVFRRSPLLLAAVLMALAVLVMPGAQPASAQAVATGSLDLSFGGDGIVTTDFGNRDEHLRAVAVQPDGKIVAAGYTQEGHSFDFALVRYTAGGEMDGSFGNGGKVTTEFGHHAHIHGMALQADGKIVVVGHTHTYRNDDFLMARYNADGTLDASFGGDGKVSLDFNGGFDYAFGAAVQPDGKILVAGTALVDGTYDFALARYNADGTLDASFGSGGKVTTEFGAAGYPQNDQSQALALQSDGKIVVAGYSSTRKSGGEVSTDFALARYNSDGTLDTSFHTDGKVTTHFGKGNDRIYKVAALPNGKIVAMGRSFSETNREVDFEVARYNSDGTLDTSFGNGGKVRTDLGHGEYGYAGVVQPDGKIVVAGYVHEAALGNAPASHDQLVVRYNADGSADTSFGSDGVARTDIGGNDQVYAAALQPDGKILVAGNSSIDGNYDLAVTRYHGQAQQQTRYADLIARMKEWRNDPCCVSHKPHTDRWDRVLLTFGETVADTSLSTMTAAEAQTYADKGWERWVNVAAALREIESGGQQAPPPNQAPTVSGAIADSTIVNESGTRQVSLSGVFSDADNDTLTVTAASSDETKATVSVAADYSGLTVSAQARGTATITVTASDGNGGAVSDTFTIRVKAAPVVESAIADVSGLEVGATQEVSLSGVFSDADSDALTITAASSANAIATAVASGSSTLTLTGVAEGTATITVTAQDADGNGVSDSFDVSVAAPQQQGDQTPYADLIAKIKEWRNDPCCASNKAHTDRWDRALLAFGEPVSDTSLTAMTAAESQTYADRGWTRWVEVTDALRELEAAAADENPPEVGPDLDDTSPDPPAPEPEVDTEPPQTEQRSEIVTRYDANSDGAIDVSEYRRAVYDHMDGLITYAELMEVVTAYRLP